jgi:hypothetical protein
VEDGMLWRNGCDGKVLRCGAGKRHQHSSAKCPGSGTEIIPGKHSDTRIKPLALTNGHGRYITVTPERTLASVGECPLNI